MFSVETVRQTNSKYTRVSVYYFPHDVTRRLLWSKNIESSVDARLVADCIADLLKVVKKEVYHLA